MLWDASKCEPLFRMTLTEDNTPLRIAPLVCTMGNTVVLTTNYSPLTETSQSYFLKAAPFLEHRVSLDLQKLSDCFEKHPNDLFSAFIAPG